MSSGQKLVAIAIDKDKGSQAALKWAIQTICKKGQKILLIHVKLRPPGKSPALAPTLDEISEQCNAFDELDPQTRELLLPFRVLCSRKEINTQEIVLEDVEIAKALIGFVQMSAIEVLVLGAAAKGLFRLKIKDIPGTVLKGVPDFCSVYIISKGKISASRYAARLAPPVNTFRRRMLHQSSIKSTASHDSFSSSVSKGSFRSMYEATPRQRNGDSTSMKSPFTHRIGANGKPHEYTPPPPESDITFVSSGRPSVETAFPSFFGDFEDPNQWISGFSELDTTSFAPMNLPRSSENTTPQSEISLYASFENDSFTSQNMGDADEEMQRLRQELKQTMEMYNSACKQVLTTTQKALELEEKKQSEESEKSRVATENVEPDRRIPELEHLKRVDSERKLIKVKEKFSTSDIGYRKYTIEEIEDATDYFSQSRKIGVGIYGPIYKCYLDRSHVAVKVLRPDAAQGRSKFQKEVEILSCIRHPNMVSLLGACPEYGCLVYEYIFNGSLEDRLMHRGKSQPLSWKDRFRIAAEITSGLLFLHKTTPVPIVHRDLNPGNILLDKNLVSKINDVGLANFVPPSVVHTVTQNRMSSAVGDFCYIDPEYQQTGVIGVKSDIYCLGLIFLQLLTSRPPTRLAHQIRRAIESGALLQMLDPAVPDWPVEDALCLANLALQCCELRSIDRPDLGKVVLPELERLRALSEETNFSSSVNPHRLSIKLPSKSISTSNMI